MVGEAVEHGHDDALDRLEEHVDDDVDTGQASVEGGGVVEDHDVMDT